MGKATYQLNKPFQFMKKGYSDSLNLVMAFLEHWDVAISIFRRGDMQSFWTEYVTNGEKEAADYFAKAYNAMWKDVGKEDVLFQRVIHYIEPNLEGMPLISAGEKTAKLYNFEELADWLEELLVDKEWDLVPLEKPKTFDAESYNLLWLYEAMREGVISAYRPDLKKLEANFVAEVDDEDRLLQCRQMVAKLRGQIYFTFDGQIYTSLCDLFTDKVGGKALGDYYRLLGILFQSQDSLSELERWSKEAQPEEGEAFRKLKEKWENLHQLMAEKEGGLWYEKYKLPTWVPWCVLDPTLNFEACTQQKKEECLEWWISDAKKMLADCREKGDFYLAHDALLSVSVGEKMLYTAPSQHHPHSLYTSCKEDEADCKKLIEALEKLLPVVKNKDYVAFFNEAAEGTERCTLFRYAIWPTATMEEDYIEKFFEAWEEFLQKKVTEGEYSSNLKSDIKHTMLTLWKLVEVWCKDDFADTRKVNGVPISEYYIKKIDRIGMLSEKILQDDTYAEQRKKICAFYGKMVGRIAKNNYESMLKKSEKILWYGSLRATLEYKGDAQGVPKKLYESWDEAYREFYNIWRHYDEAHKSYKESLGKLVDWFTDGEEPWGAIVENKHNQVKDTQSQIGAWIREYEQTDQALSSLRKKIEESKEALDKEWKKEQEKREKGKKAKKRREERKSKRKKFFGALWSIITFPFKVILSVLFIPIVIWKRNAFFGIVTTVVYIAFLCFFFRFATPTYYGTDFYLGNKLGYTHYKVADGVTCIEESTFSGAKRMKRVELPESLTSIGSGAFANCESLTEITIPENVTYIGSYAFLDCKYLEKIRINAPSFTLDGQVFNSCVSLTTIETAAPVDEWEATLENNTYACRNLDMPSGIEAKYVKVPEDFDLLENDIQLQHAINCGSRSDEAINFNWDEDKLHNVQIGEEEKTENGRSVSVSFTKRSAFVEVDVKGTLTTSPCTDGWENVSGTFELLDKRVRADKLEAMQQQFAEGNFTEVEALLDNRTFTVGEESISFGEGQVKVEQAQVVPLFTAEVNEAGETVLPENPAYRIAIKAFVDKNLNDYTFMGNILLSEKHSYVPQVITNMSEWNGLNLLGTYEYTNEDGVHQFTIDSQYDNIYTVTDNSRHSNVTYLEEEAAVNQKRLLVLNDDGKSGKMVSANNVGDYSVWDVEINAYKDGLELKSTGSLYKKVSDEVTLPDEEFNNPLVGVWEGVYDTSRSHVASRRYIFPAGGEYLTVISKFGPTSQTPDFKSGATVDVLLWNEEYNSGIIESRAWVHQPDGYNFVIFEGNLDESGTVMSGGGEYPFTMTKTEAHNESYSYGTNNGEGWSIYDGNGNPWAALFAVSDNIPTDALQFGGSYYKFYSNASSWEDAQADCVEQGGHLAIIDSGEENAFLHSYFVKYGYERCYFGLSDVAEEGNWTWIDGVSNKNRYSNWNSAEPNGDSVYEDYGEFWNRYTDGTWNDCKFYGDAGYICEWDGLVFEAVE